MDYYFAQILISPNVERKIHAKHGIYVKDLRMALIYGENYKSRWDPYSSNEGSLIVISQLANGRKFMAHLLPVDIDEGIWILKTAYHLDK